MMGGQVQVNLIGRCETPQTHPEAGLDLDKPLFPDRRLHLELSRSEAYLDRNPAI